MLALRGRNAAILPSRSANCTSDGLGTRSARAHRANARAGPINPSADLAGRATRLGLEVIAKNPRQDFDQPGCQDGLRLTLTNQVLSRAFSFIFIIREVSAVGWRIIGLSSDELVSNSPGLYPSHDETFWSSGFDRQN